ncbi:hypothetical protein BDZ90DRAFT_230160 [Jaminaea rosea]|uniref:Uncharacterized protein n=1 Tax=Jaminaea rosea TaxID=1569628 RepID=A0A316V119_9BASI|nr:hypothetical protein BDZ90DRAFT_230160 [Jaminaea rosea]PWN31172.1 hypothetical protein BDZ90DRAFT_230160 [Jaminaea rosea]
MAGPSYAAPFSDLIPRHQPGVASSSHGKRKPVPHDARPTSPSWTDDSMSSSSRGSPSRPKRPSTAPLLSLSTASTAQAEDSFVPPPPLARRTARHASSSDEPFSFAMTPPAPSSGSAPSSTLSDAAARGDLAAFLDVVLASHRLTPPAPALVAGPVDYVASLRGAASRLASSFERREGARRGSGQATMSGAVLLRKLEQLALELAQGTEQGQVLWPTDVECLRDGLHFMLVLSEAQTAVLRSTSTLKEPVPSPLNRRHAHRNSLDSANLFGAGPQALGAKAKLLKALGIPSSRSALPASSVGPPAAVEHENGNTLRRAKSNESLQAHAHAQAISRLLDSRHAMHQEVEELSAAVFAEANAMVRSEREKVAMLRQQVEEMRRRARYDREVDEDEDEALRRPSDGTIRAARRGDQAAVAAAAAAAAAMRREKQEKEQEQSLRRARQAREEGEESVRRAREEQESLRRVRQAREEGEESVRRAREEQESLRRARQAREEEESLRLAREYLGPLRRREAEKTTRTSGSLDPLHGGDSIAFMSGEISPAAASSHAGSPVGKAAQLHPHGDSTATSDSDSDDFQETEEYLPGDDQREDDSRREARSPPARLTPFAPATPRLNSPALSILTRAGSHGQSRTIRPPSRSRNRSSLPPRAPEPISPLPDRPDAVPSTPSTVNHSLDARGSLLRSSASSSGSGSGSGSSRGDVAPSSPPTSDANHGSEHAAMHWHPFSAAAVSGLGIGAEKPAIPQRIESSSWPRPPSRDGRDAGLDQPEEQATAATPPRYHPRLPERDTSLPPSPARSTADEEQEEQAPRNVVRLAPAPISRVSNSHAPTPQTHHSLALSRETSRTSGATSSGGRPPTLSRSTTASSISASMDRSASSSSSSSTTSSLRRARYARRDHELGLPSPGIDLEALGVHSPPVASKSRYTKGSRSRILGHSNASGIGVAGFAKSPGSMLVTNAGAGRDRPRRVGGLRDSGRETPPVSSMSRSSSRAQSLNEVPRVGNGGYGRVEQRRGVRYPDEEGEEDEEEGSEEEEEREEREEREEQQQWGARRLRFR